VIRLCKALLLVSLCVFAWTALNAQTAAGKGSYSANQDKLKLVVVVSRHGVRSPTWTVDRLNTYSSKPWPAWSVPPGYLTAHGFELMKLFGAYDRASLANAGLLPPRAAPEHPIPTSGRTPTSALWKVARLWPRACSQTVQLRCILLARERTTLSFHAPPEAMDSAESSRVFAEFSTRVTALPASPYNGLLEQMNRVLLGCELDADCTPARPPEVPLMEGKNGAVKGKGDHIVTLQGPLAQASSFAEDFQLEYTEGMPSQSVGWGR